jgi:hypothetical protein
MPPRFLLDENLRGGSLWQALHQHNATSPNPLDVVRVGDPADLPLRSSDADILLWAEREDRIFISRDKKTLPGHLTDHLNAAHHSPGIFIPRRGSTIDQIVAYLELAAYAGDSATYRDTITFIP